MKICKLVMSYYVTLHFDNYIYYIYIYKDGCCRSKKRIRIYLKYEGPWRDLYFLNLFILFLHTCYIYGYVSSFFLSSENRYSMRLELTSVSSINESCLVGLVFIRVFMPFSLSVFTLVCFAKKNSLIYISIYPYIYMGAALGTCTNFNPWEGCDTRSVFKQSLTCLNSSFSFSKTGCLTMAKDSCLPTIDP